MSVQRVAAGVYRINLAWGNAYALTDGREAALIDTGLQQDRPALLSALCEIGLEPEQVRAVYLTHGHCDHAGNAAWFAGRSQQGAESERGAVQRARIYAGIAEVRFLSLPFLTYAPRGWRRILRPLTTTLFLAGERLYPVERGGVDVSLRDGDRVDAPGGVLRVVATPGHTLGHISFFREQDGVLFSGDAVLNIIPIRRVTALSLPIRQLSNDWRETKRSARRLVELRPSVLLAGHGAPLFDDTARRLSDWANTL